MAFSPELWVQLDVRKIMVYMPAFQIQMCPKVRLNVQMCEERIFLWKIDFKEKAIKK